MPQALKPRDFEALLRTMLCFAGYPDQDSEPRVQVTSDDEKGSSRQVQALKTNQNETIRAEESLPQHDGPEASSWRAQVGPHVAGRSIQPRRINPIESKANRQGGPDDERRLSKGGRRDIRFALTLVLILLVHPSSSSLSTTTSPELSNDYLEADANAGCKRVVEGPQGVLGRRAPGLPHHAPSRAHNRSEATQRAPSQHHAPSSVQLQRGNTQGTSARPRRTAQDLAS